MTATAIVLGPPTLSRVANAGYTGLTGKVTEIVRINHDGEINKCRWHYSITYRARCMPQDPMLLATKTVMGDVFLFDVRKHPSIPRDPICRPNWVLKGHTKEGYGLSWSPLRKGFIASGSDDQRVCVWDIQGNADPLNVQPLISYKEQGDIVEVAATRRDDA